MIMYSMVAPSAVTAIALVLLFSSSLAVCCLCTRIYGRRRYKPATRDELERPFVPSHTQPSAPVCASADSVSVAASSVEVAVAKPTSPASAVSAYMIGRRPVTSIGKQLTASIRRKLLMRCDEMRPQCRQPSNQFGSDTVVVMTPAMISCLPVASPALRCYDNASYIGDNDSGSSRAASVTSSHERSSTDSLIRHYGVDAGYAVAIATHGSGLPFSHSHAGDPQRLLLADTAYALSRETEL